MNIPSNAHYFSYLLRLWQESPQAGWRASVQSVQSKEIVHFVCLEELVEFLWLQGELAEKESTRPATPIQP